MSDNGRAFTSVWEDVEHRFDQTLRPYGVEHLLIPPVKSDLELDISSGLELDTLRTTPRVRVA